MVFMLAIDVHNVGHPPLGPPCLPHFVAALAIVFILLGLVGAALRSPSCPLFEDKDRYPVALPRSSISTAWPFFCRRFDFLNAGFQSTGQSLFKFKLFKHTVVAVSGEAGREAFLKAKAFDLNEGFAMLSGAIPMVRGITSELHRRRVALIYKRLLDVQRAATLGRLIPKVLGDTKQIMESWGKLGSFDPFASIYHLMFQTTTRCLTCHEIADDPAIVARLRHQYEILDHGTTIASVLFPWLPSYAMIKKWIATLKIFNILLAAVNAREKCGVQRDDTLQMLLDCKDERMVILGFFMGLIVAGARSTGTAATWLLIYLGTNPEWKAKAAAEVNDLLADQLFPPDQKYSLSAHLAMIPLETWESETPILDSLIRETLRIAQPHTAMRRNTGPDISIGDRIVPAGSYVVYPFSDIHLNERYYPNPWRFDPGRNHDSKIWMGFGRGNVTCMGMRLAKLELKLVISMMLLGFRHSVVNEAGLPPSPGFHPDWNDYMGCRPSKEAIFVKYERTDVPL